MPNTADLREEEDSSDRRLVLGDLINHVLDKGVVISGHVIISVAEIDLVALDLRLVLSSVQTALEHSVSTTHGDVSLLRADSTKT
jgi:hypothetical protein